MTKAELISEIASRLKRDDVRKIIRAKTVRLNISDDEGNSSNLTLNIPQKSPLFTRADVEAVVESFIEVVADVIRRGETLNIRELFEIGVKYKRPMQWKNPRTGVIEMTEGRYVPRVLIKPLLKQSAMVYTQRQKEQELSSTPVDFSKYDHYDIGGEVDE